MSLKLITSSVVQPKMCTRLYSTSFKFDSYYATALFFLEHVDLKFQGQNSNNYCFNLYHPFVLYRLFMYYYFVKMPGLSKPPTGGRHIVFGSVDVCVVIIVAVVCVIPCKYDNS